MKHARLFKRTQKSKKTYFKDLQDGQMAVITGGTINANIGKIVVKVYREDIVQILGYSDSWSHLRDNPF